MRFVIFDCPTETTLPLYLEELKTRNVTDVVRVCEPTYNKAILENRDVKVSDWPFPDGSIPPATVIQSFLALCDERFPGGIAGVATAPDVPDSTAAPLPAIGIHCVAGLGRAPVLVTIALIEAGMKPLDAVDFVRKRRRGAFNNVQLTYLVENYKRMWKKSMSSSSSSAGVRWVGLLGGGSKRSSTAGTGTGSSLNVAASASGVAVNGSVGASGAGAKVGGDAAAMASSSSGNLLLMRKKSSIAGSGSEDEKEKEKEVSPPGATNGSTAATKDRAFSFSKVFGFSRKSTPPPSS
ncbi:Protein tyrosine phosphatase prl-1 [Chytridiales sp. JEL 0842]|nr:Protein tyrosine phosphatase prl-1 [Chytridiales sp. JEL 0842]